MTNVKLFNQKTGLWFRRGVNFTEECMFRATPLDAPEAAFVRATFDGPIGVHVVGSLVDGYLLECDCQSCQAEADHEDNYRN